MASSLDRNRKSSSEGQMDLTLVQLASRWGCTIASLHEKCERGEIPHFRIGELYRFPLSLVEEYEAKLLRSGSSN
ncbi:MAG: helix-turn-helix domain-containing protein [Pseudomonadota bacterium]